MCMAVPFVDSDAIRTATFIRHVEVYETLGSTNDRAAELACDSNIKLPALVVTRHQTAGRGRGQNKWWSADGALTFSVLLEPAELGIATANWPQLSLVTAVAICDALQNDGTTAAAIKWPNDVMLDGRKVAGILIESPGGSAPAKNRVIIGVGINVNNSWREAKLGDAPNATALCDITARPHGLQLVLIRVLRAIAVRALQLRSHKPELARAWQKLDLLAGQDVVVETDCRRVEGKCVEIAEDGALIVQTALRQQQIYSGSVRLQ